MHALRFATRLQLTKHLLPRMPPSLSAQPVPSPFETQKAFTAPLCPPSPHTHSRSLSFPKPSQHFGGAPFLCHYTPPPWYFSFMYRAGCLLDAAHLGGRTHVGSRPGSTQHPAQETVSGSPSHCRPITRGAWPDKLSHRFSSFPSGFPRTSLNLIVLTGLFRTHQ